MSNFHQPTGSSRIDVLRQERETCIARIEQARQEELYFTKMLTEVLKKIERVERRLKAA